MDCGNGTVNDTVTGLLWLQDANCFGPLSYAAANTSAVGLASGMCGLSDGSVAGDWRLPTKAEWEATIERAVALHCIVNPANGDMPPSLTNTLGTACYAVGPQPFVDVQSRYWSALADGTHPWLAWIVRLEFGALDVDALKTQAFHVWPVRAGH